jgi:hypothetical protein
MHMARLAPNQVVAAVEIIMEEYKAAPGQVIIHYLQHPGEPGCVKFVK